MYVSAALIYAKPPLDPRVVFDKTVPWTKVLVSEGEKERRGREEKSFSKSSLAAFSSGQRIGGSVCSTQVLFTFGGRINEQPCWRAFSPTPTRGSTRKTAHFDTGITTKGMWPYNGDLCKNFIKHMK